MLTLVKFTCGGLFIYNELLRGKTIQRCTLKKGDEGMKKSVSTRRAFTLVVVFVGLVFLLGLVNPGVGRVSAQDGPVIDK